MVEYWPTLTYRGAGRIVKPKATSMFWKKKSRDLISKYMKYAWLLLHVNIIFILNLMFFTQSGVPNKNIVFSNNLTFKLD